MIFQSIYYVSRRLLTSSHFRSIDFKSCRCSLISSEIKQNFFSDLFRRLLGLLRFKMPPPTPLQCSSTECDYETPAGCPTWELMVTLLTQHSQTVHGGGHSTAPQNSKLEKLPRPTFTLNMTESQWSYKKVMWGQLHQAVFSVRICETDATSSCMR